MSSAATVEPEAGSVWGGGGLTCRVIEVIDGDVRVLRLTGRGRVLKRPSEIVVIPLNSFRRYMRPTEIPKALMPRG